LSINSGNRIPAGNFELATVMNRRVRWAEFDEGGRRDLSALRSSLPQKVAAINNHFLLF
jgi:hypothetical protein